jgi:integrase
MINAQIEAGRSPRAIQYTRAVLRTALSKAEKWGLAARNVARLVDVPPARRQEIRPLTPTEAGRLLDSVAGQDRTLYLLTIGLGLRQGEALALRWRDRDLDSATLVVNHTLQRIGGRAVLADPKTAKSRRTLAVPAPVLASLREQRTRQLTERLAAGDAWVDGDYVFCSAIGTALDASAVTHRFQRQLAAAGLPRQRFHDLRHGCASYLLAAGVPLKVVQEVLGHSQLSTTADVYAHVAPKLQREAAARLGAILERRASS